MDEPRWNPDGFTGSLLIASNHSGLKKEPTRKRIYKTRDVARHLCGVGPEAFETASL